MLLNKRLKPGPFPRPAAEKFKPLTEFMTERLPPPPHLQGQPLPLPSMQHLQIVPIQEETALLPRLSRPLQPAQQRTDTGFSGAGGTLESVGL